MPTSAASAAAARALSPVSSTGAVPVSAVQRGDGRGGVGPEPVGDAEHPDRAAVDADDDRGRPGLLQLGHRAAAGAGVGGRQAGGAADLDARGRPTVAVTPRPGAEVKSSARGQRQRRVARGGDDGAGQRVLAGVLGGGGQREQLVLVQPGAGQRADRR